VEKQGAEEQCITQGQSQVVLGEHRIAETYSEVLGGVLMQVRWRGWGMCQDWECATQRVAV
jgi:hypothetical protein